MYTIADSSEQPQKTPQNECGPTAVSQGNVARLGDRRDRMWRPPLLHQGVRALPPLLEFNQHLLRQLQQVVGDPINHQTRREGIERHQED